MIVTSRLARYVWAGIFWFTLCVVCLPGVLSFLRGFDSASGHQWEYVFYRPFYDTVKRTLWLLGGTVLVSIPLSGFLAVALVLAGARVRHICIGLLVFPLLFPPFFWSIGIQGLMPLLPTGLERLVDGFMGSLLSCLMVALPLGALTTLVSLERVPQSTLESALVHGGIPLLQRILWTRCSAAAAAGAVFGAILALFDTGVGNIMGFHTLAGDIHVALLARMDERLAINKAVAMFLIVGPVAGVAVFYICRTLTLNEPGRQFLRSGATPVSHEQSLFRDIVTLGFSGALTIVAVGGLVRPLSSGTVRPYFAESWTLMRESAETTFVQAGAAGFGATTLGWLIFVLGSYLHSGRKAVAAVLLFLVAIPPSLHALGAVSVKVHSTWAQDAFGGSIATGLVLGIRFVPLGVISAAIALGKIPRSTTEVAIICGIPLRRVLRALYFPLCLGHFMFTAVILGILSLADVGNATLLQTPGSSTFGGHLLARMDNSPEKLISAMCITSMLIILTIVSIMGVVRFCSKRYHTTQTLS